MEVSLKQLKTFSRLTYIFLITCIVNLESKCALAFVKMFVCSCVRVPVHSVFLSDCCVLLFKQAQEINKNLHKNRGNSYRAVWQVTGMCVACKCTDPASAWCGEWGGDREDF